MPKKKKKKSKGRREEKWSKLKLRVFQDAFESALENGDEVEYFLETTPEKRIRWDDRANVLIFSARRGFRDAVRIILEEYDKDIIDKPGLINGHAALHYASMFGHEDIVRMLLKHNADIHIRGEFNGSTPLHFAVRHSHYDIVNLLIQNGADVNAKDYSGNSVLCVASEDKKFRSASEYKKFCSSKSVACVLRLLICGAKIDDKALEKDSFNMLKHIKKGTRNRLYFAAIYGLYDLTSELLYKGETIVNYENYMWEMDRTCLLEKLTSGKKGRFSKLERKAFEDIAFVFIRKIPTVAFKVFCGVRSCMTYVGLCCARGFTQSDNDEIDKYPYKYPYFTYIRLDRHFLDYYSYFDAKSSDPVISSRRRWIGHSPRLRYHGHTESMPAGITKKWHHDNSIYCLSLEYSYVYSHEDNFWVWKYQSVNPTMIAAQEA